MQLFISINLIDTEVCEEDDVVNDLSMSFNDLGAAAPPLVLWIVHFLAILYRKCSLTKTALALLLQFLKIFFTVLCQISPLLNGLAQHFPCSIHEMEKLLGTRKETEFIRYVVCGKCHNVYKYEDCIEGQGSMQVPQICKYRSSNQGRRCNGALLKRVELMNSKIIHYPIKVYCYMKLHNYLYSLLNRPGFIELCDHWKRETGATDKGMLKDVYDGKIWQDFQVYNGKTFLSDPFSYGMMLNIDWFKPCKHVEYSIGAIYLTVMNLPRSVRFRQENVMLIGLLPGPREPKHDINAFLGPLVHELQSFWCGTEMNISSTGNVKIRCALLCVACDIPASRKVCGFLGHSANFGCSKCFKKFSGSVGSKNYSGFDRSTWPERTMEQHRRDIIKIRQCKTMTARCQQESRCGSRYSALLDLSYFNPIRMTIIDPMHNLYLGSAKRLLHIWNEKDLITDSDMIAIQSRIDTIKVPPYVGRIPLKIASSFSGFTADQFKNWTNLFSIIALHNILPHDDLQCWRHFVSASRILCQVAITQSEIELADAHLLQFCIRVERLYGPSVITPNMHLHCHLKQSLYDYGPIHNFWLFSYERYNGILENFPSSNRSLEIQLMNRFLREFQSFIPTSWPKEFESDFAGFFATQLKPDLQGSVETTIHGRAVDRVDPYSIIDWCLPAPDHEEDLSFPKSYVRSVLHDTAMSQLKNVYLMLYPSIKSVFSTPPFVGILL